MDWNILLENWHVKLVAAIMIWAAWIDGKELKVPNWLTFPMVLTGLIYGLASGGWNGLGLALLGMTVGLATMLPIYSVGGMGAGDVKLMAGLGAWLGWEVAWNAFIWTTITGAIMALIMVAYTGQWKKHYGNFLMIWNELTTIRDPKKLTDIAAERKPRMFLLPYGIPMTVASIAYFFYSGML
ncbi:MAG: prepilin peptidase [Planctomycetota bacterium]|nr:MAG: prepilin peptidase [Planctomycetota bacterium]